MHPFLLTSGMISYNLPINLLILRQYFLIYILVWSTTKASVVSISSIRDQHKAMVSIRINPEDGNRLMPLGTIVHMYPFGP